MSSSGGSQAAQTAAPAGDLGGQLPSGVRAFMARQSAGATVLLAATLTALVWANSLQPSPPPVPLPVITPDDVHLVCWLAVVTA